jgi:hypothetical protein
MVATKIEEGATQGDAGGTEGAADDEKVEEVTPSPSCGKRAPRYVQGSGKKAKTTNAFVIQEAVTSMASSANEYAARKVGKYTIEEVMNIVIACGAEYGSNQHYIATELFVKKEQRDMFMTFPTDEIRFIGLVENTMTGMQSRPMFISLSLVCYVGIIVRTSFIPCLPFSSLLCGFNL